MKKSRGFTLIELLIVTVVIVTLMAIVFRLAGTGGESTKRAKTLARLQKLSNALSGYYAAFGSYPPVPLQGRSRDIYTKVDKSGAATDSRDNCGSLGYGIQGGAGDRNVGSLDSDEMKRQIEAACRAQPVAAGFPLNYKEDAEIITVICQTHGVQKNYEPISSYGGFNRNSSEWSENNVFMFGLLSFLLPRYQFMLSGEKDLYKDSPSGPWTKNNRLPYLLDGTRPNSWEEVQKWMGAGPDYSERGSSDKQKRAMIENLPSQKVCARWMPNFKGIVESDPVSSSASPDTSTTRFYGVETDAGHEDGHRPEKWFVVSPNGYNHEATYINGTKTVRDGWGEDFYYYSLPPYQSYQLWSSGPNKRTFPPWMEPPSGDQKLVNEWIADDIKVGDK